MRLSALCLALILMTNSANADIVFSLESFKGSQQTSVFTPGDVATIKLIATDPDGAELGTLYWYGFTARITATTSDPNTASVNVNNLLFTSDLSNHASFNTPTGSTLAGQNTWPLNLSANGNVLATFEFGVTQDTVFKFNDSDAAFNLYSLGLGGLLGPAALGAGVAALGQDSAGFSVSVPEPASLSSLVLLCTGLAGYRRRIAISSSRPS